MCSKKKQKKKKRRGELKKYNKMIIRKLKKNIEQSCFEGLEKQ